MGGKRVYTLHFIQKIIAVSFLTWCYSPVAVKTEHCDVFVSTILLLSQSENMSILGHVDVF